MHELLVNGKLYTDYFNVTKKTWKWRNELLLLQIVLISDKTREGWG